MKLSALAVTLAAIFFTGCVTPPTTPPVLPPPPVMYGIGSGVGDASSNLYRINNFATAPTAANVGETGTRLLDIAVHPTTGVIFATDGLQLFTLNPTTGARTLIGFHITLDFVFGLEFNAAGELFGWGGIAGTIFRINTATGAATNVGSTNASGVRASGDLAFDVDGTLFGGATGIVGGGSGLVTINTVSFAATVIGAASPVGPYFGLAVDRQGDASLYAGVDNTANAANAVQLFRIDKGSGVPAIVGDVVGANNFGMQGLAIGPPPAGANLVAGLAEEFVTALLE